MKLVQNDMVSMDWNANGWVETKKAGFIAAVHTYDSEKEEGKKVAVAFKAGKAYAHIDEDGNDLSFTDTVSVIKKNYKDHDYPEFFEDYAEIYDGQEFTGVVGFLGIENAKEDILARLEDLSGYDMVEESEMPQ